MMPTHVQIAPAGRTQASPRLWEYCLRTAPGQDGPWDALHQSELPSGAARFPMASCARMSRTRPLTLIWDNSEGSSMGPAEGFLCSYFAVQLLPLPKPASLTLSQTLLLRALANKPPARKSLYQVCFPRNAM